jgi:hypothetical protein
MSPIDSHLRDALTRHAAEAPTEADWFNAVERRAHAMRRRRIAVVSSAAAVVLAGGVVGGLALTGDGQDRVVVPPLNPGNSSTPTPSHNPGDLSDDQPPHVLTWPYRSGDGAAALDPAGAVHPLWGGKLPTGTTVVIGQYVDDAGDVRARAWIDEQGVDPYTVDGAVIHPATTSEVSFVLPGEAYPYVLVIGAPTTGQVEYAADGTSYEPMETVEGWALFQRTGPGPGSTDGDRIRVLDGNGDLDHPLYEGPIDTGPSEPDV